MEGASSRKRPLGEGAGPSTAPPPDHEEEEDQQLEGVEEDDEEDEEVVGTVVPVDSDEVFRIPCRSKLEKGKIEIYAPGRNLFELMGSDRVGVQAMVTGQAAPVTVWDPKKKKLPAPTRKVASNAFLIVSCMAGVQNVRKLATTEELEKESAAKEQFFARQVSRSALELPTHAEVRTHAEVLSNSSLISNT